MKVGTVEYVKPVTKSTKTPKSMTAKVPKKKFKGYKTMLLKKGVNKKAKFKKI